MIHGIRFWETCFLLIPVWAWCSYRLPVWAYRWTDCARLPSAGSLRCRLWDLRMRYGKRAILTFVAAAIIVGAFVFADRLVGHENRPLYDQYGEESGSYASIVGTWIAVGFAIVAHQFWSSGDRKLRVTNARYAITTMRTELHEELEVWTKNAREQPSEGWEHIEGTLRIQLDSISEVIKLYDPEFYWRFP